MITSIRLPPALKDQLDRAASVLHRGKNWIIVQALQDYLGKVDDRFLVKEARRQSIMASQGYSNEERDWENNLDLRDWED
ncbi:CopG family ribbon-helix-helix protein [Coxiella endosymbiont of Ornithodoros maritimus]|uniref:CopG family ribbon-helix-helix protein n=1 Tax=Coxiella endosymbiont of Ornithodoros maritimus TaxID=1656172 RepID=UPI002264AA06|nr:ribbon-helix-helix domain-containing protein [Coxiella endosymbiont of Ornithodoros maritimus]